jgi:hypothetical protein
VHVYSVHYTHLHHSGRRISQCLLYSTWVQEMDMQIAKKGNWARSCKPFKEPSNRFPARRAGTTTLFVLPARQGYIGWRNRLIGIDSWRAGTTNRVIVSGRQATCWRNRFVGIDWYDP